MKSRLFKGVAGIFAATVLGVILYGTSAHAAKPPGFECPDVWNPVICNNGVVYSNDCYARRAGARGCVAY